MADDKKSWDAAVDADEASKNVRDAASGPIEQTRGLVLSKLDRAKDLTNSARHALNETAQQAWDVSKTFVVPLVDVFKRADGEEGTKIRKYVGVARERLNVQLYAARVQTKKIAENELVPVKDALAIAQQQLTKANEFRREHPEVAAVGLAVVVGVPSLLMRGKWSAVRNSVVAVGAGAGTCYGRDKLVEKKRK